MMMTSTQPDHIDDSDAQNDPSTATVDEQVDATAAAAEQAGLQEQNGQGGADCDAVEATVETTVTGEPIAADADAPAADSVPETVYDAPSSEPTRPEEVEPEFDPGDPDAAFAPVVNETATIEAEPTAEATDGSEGSESSNGAQSESSDDASRLERLEARAAALAEEVKAAANRATFLGRVQRLIKQLPEEASEQIAALRARLSDLEGEITNQIDERRTLKEGIVEKAEALANSNEWKATGEAMRGLFDQWKSIGSAGHEAEDALWKRFQAARDTFSARRNEWFEGRQKEWGANREKKEALSVRAEELSESTDWRSTADAMRNLMAEWKTVGSAGRESDDALWSRFRAAQQIFFDRRSSTYDENKARKEELVTQAEALRESTDWRATAESLKGLQASWKEIGPVGSRGVEDELWNRFRGATQAFFDRRGSTFAERDREEGDNLKRKEELCAAAEALAVAADPVAATEEAKALQAEWKTIGPIRRDRGDQLWARFRAACDRVFENSVNERARRQVQWSSKMREALDRKEEQLMRMEEAIRFDEATVQRWQASIEAKPDASISAKIAETTNRIAEKRARAAELKASVDDIRVKMK